jgi:hypothetical protein
VDARFIDEYFDEISNFSKELCLNNGFEDIGG